MSSASTPTTPKPLVSRRSTESSAVSSTSTDSAFPTGLFSRIRTSRSRSPHRSNTSGLPSPTAEPHRPHRLHLRSDSNSSGPLATPSPRARSRSAKRNSGTIMQVGRHSNDWLFGGFSLRETVKGLISPSQSEHGRE